MEFDRTYRFDDVDDLRALDGPWQDEPDKAQWVDAPTSLDCLIVRNRMGAWCGYVGLPSAHPLHHVGYDDAYERAPSLDVHGGLTFAEHCRPGEGDRGICHVPLAGRDDHIWWLGFDCNHGGDFAPGLTLIDRELTAKGFPPMPSWPGDVYRDVGYVVRQTTRLATQLATVA